MILATDQFLLLMFSLAVASCSSPATAVASSGHAETGAQAQPGKADEKSQPRGEITVGKVRLRLDGCDLLHGTGPLESASLGLTPPCAFSKRKDGSIRIVPIDSGRVLLVESSRPLPLAAGQVRADCDTQLRAVVVRGNQVLLSRDTQKVASCAPNQWDEKMFHILAFDAVAP